MLYCLTSVVLDKKLKNCEIVADSSHIRFATFINCETIKNSMENLKNKYTAVSLFISKWRLPCNSPFSSRAMAPVMSKTKRQCQISILNNILETFSILLNHLKWCLWLKFAICMCQNGNIMLYWLREAVQLVT